MEISVKNLGVLKQASFTLNDLTIICGKNNTGKTYATYALYGFLSFWHRGFTYGISNSTVHRLLRKGKIELDMQSHIDVLPKFLKDRCESFTRTLSSIFASRDKYFSESHFSVKLDNGDVRLRETFERTLRTEEGQVLSLVKKANSKKLTVALLVEKESIETSRNLIIEAVSSALQDILFKNLFPLPFIASAERTGAALFRNNLDVSFSSLPVKNYYALPVRANVEFARKIETVTIKDSFIKQEHPEIFDDFSDIIGGEYRVTKSEGLHFVPRGGKIKLTMDESSSSVRSLLMLGFYLRHLAQRGDILLVDEPELNLHPENQRRMAKLFVRLINIGVKVFVTTHSDYIIKELNTLIMLNQGGERLQKLAEREEYKKSEFLNHERVSVYTAKESTLVPADIDPESGIEVSSFDETIDDMNRIQDEIFWGDNAQ